MAEMPAGPLGVRAADGRFEKIRRDFWVN